MKSLNLHDNKISSEIRKMFQQTLSRVESQFTPFSGMELAVLNGHLLRSGQGLVITPDQLVR